MPALPPALPVTSRTAATATDEDDNGLAVIAVVNVINQCRHLSSKKLVRFSKFIERLSLFGAVVCLELLQTCSALAHHGNHAAAVILAASVSPDRLLDRNGFDTVVQGGSLRRLGLLAIKLEKNIVELRI